MEYNQDSDEYDIASTLTWDQYQNYCHQPAWEESSSKAQVQVQCAQLEGIPISWEGYVTNIRLKSIKNNIAVILNRLPDNIRTIFSCMYGEPYEENCISGDDTRRKNCKHITNIQKKRKNSLVLSGVHAWRWIILSKRRHEKTWDGPQFASGTLATWDIKPV